jgi:hypothetical protein
MQRYNLLLKKQKQLIPETKFSRKFSPKGLAIDLWLGVISIVFVKVLPLLGNQSSG